jgi:hypothetical protein
MWLCIVTHFSQVDSSIRVDFFLSDQMASTLSTYLELQRNFFTIEIVKSAFLYCHH